MSIVMRGLEVAGSMKEKLQEEFLALKERGIIPHLAIVRVGARPDDLAYERGAKKRMNTIGIKCTVFEIPEDVDQELFELQFGKINSNPEIHGILLFRPLPKHLNEESLKGLINPLKDVDSMSPVNAAKVFSGDETCFAPCTPESVIEILDYYNIDITGKKVVVLGRSMVVGKPLSMLLLKKNATVTICHTKTKNLEKVCREAEILIAAAGKAKMVTQEMVGDNAIVIDVGINLDEEGNLCGDVDYKNVEGKSSYITPVPGGVGSVTSSVLAKHVITAAKCLNCI